MEEESLLKQPADRRLGDNNTLPPGPPGAEFDTEEFALKSAPPTAAVTKTNENTSIERSSRRRSPTGSPPPRKRRSKSRGRRSPSPPRNRSNRNRRSPSPMRRNRYREYTPDRRRYGRRSPDRRRYGSRGMGRDRYRGRGRSSSRSLSRSATPPTRRGGRWSPKKKPSSPPPPQPAGLVQPPPISNQPPPPPYGVMAPQMYGDAYGAAAGYSQYGVPPPQPGFAQPSDAYATTGFNAAYPPPGTWGVDAYGQQQWMPPPTQIRQMPPPQQQTQPPTSPVGVAPAPSNPTVATNVPPPVAMTKSVHVLPDAAPGTIEANPQHDAVAQEAENQRDEIRKQRTSYLKKTAVLKKELKMLKEQRKDLHSGKAPASPTTKGFIDENEKLQSQIQKKLNTIENVIDMLTGIIGEDNLDKDDEPADDGDVPPSAKDVASTKSSASSGAVLRTAERLSTPSEKKTQSSSSSSDESSSDSSSSSSESSSSSDNETTNKPDNDDDSSPERLKKKVIESMRNKERETSRNKPVDVKIPTKKERFNYVFYDPEMHWCQTCNIFPKTAKDYLNHLHSKDHMDRESIETPWHADMVSDQFPTYENVPTKRTPIRGLTFFVPATSWFCKLCNIWMGDLHCASTHLKSQLHANKYNSFLEENPHYEVNWLADRQKVLNDQKLNPLPQQITSVSTTAAERKKSKKDDEKASKKRKRKSDKKQKKKKKKSNKKRKKGDSESSSSSSSNSSSSSDTDEPKKKKMQNIEIKDLDNPNPAVSIRLSMRKQENVKLDDAEVPQAPPPPQLKIAGKNEQMHQPPAGGKWTVVQEGVKQKTTDGEDDGIMQEWNTVQPVISESEKKLLEQLKGKLKSKSSSDQLPAGNISNSSVTAAHSGKNELEKENRGRGDRYDRRDIRDNRDNRDRRTSRRRTVSRSPTRSRSRGRDYRRHMRRSRTRSRGRMSPRGGWRGRRRHDRSRSRSLRRRSRSIDRRRRSTRSRSPSRGRVEKPIVRQPEFRPRVPEKDKEKEKKSSENKEKKEKAKLKAPPASSSASNNNSGKKLPFIGKMPVFKKQASGQLSEAEKQLGEQQLAAGYMYPMDASAYTTTQQRPPAPTAAQIQMAMMEDAYGNAPPFHPDAGMMVDYDDLMPDPVQFVNIMGQAPPPPPPQASDEKDMLPPGIDEEESEEFMPKPITEAPPPPPPGKGVLPKDLEDALNIIFPGDKKPGDDGDKAKATKGETQIIDDDPKFEPEELAKDGIHLVTLEETSQLGLDEASQMSMNEPLVFNRPAATTTLLLAADMDIEDSNSRNTMEPSIEQTAPPPSQTVTCVTAESAENSKEASALIINSKKPIEENSDNLKHSDTNEETILITMPESIPIPVSKPIEESMPTVPENIPTPTAMESEPQLTMADKSCELQISAKDEANNLETIAEIDLADIPQPPPSPTESEKNRRQEELDDLAMLGIDADDMAAQCM